MKTCIRFFCVSLLLKFCLFAEQPILFESTLEMNSTWSLGEKPVTIFLKQQQSAELLFKSFHQEDLHFPLDLKLTLRNMKLEMNVEGKTIQNDLSNPGQITPLVQLAYFKDKPIDLTLIKKEPFATFKEPFDKQFLHLEVFEQPLFEGIFIEPIHQLIELISGPLKVGEGVQIIREKSETNPYSSTLTFTVRKIEGDEIIVDSTWNVERQKSLLKGEKFPIAAVIYGELKGLWILSKQNPLLFKFEDKGALYYSLGLENEQASIAHQIHRNGSTRQ